MKIWNVTETSAQGSSNSIDNESKIYLYQALQEADDEHWDRAICELDGDWQQQHQDTADQDGETTHSVRSTHMYNYNSLIYNLILWSNNVDFSGISGRARMIFPSSAWKAREISIA